MKSLYIAEQRGIWCVKVVEFGNQLIITEDIEGVQEIIEKTDLDRNIGTDDMPIVIGTNKIMVKRLYNRLVNDLIEEAEELIRNYRDMLK